MKNKFIILIVLTGINSFISAEWSYDELELANKLGHDAVICQFTPKEDSTNRSGSNAVSFLALQCLDRNKKKFLEKQAVSSDYYKLQAELSGNKMEKAFYACMSHLDNPETAVQDGKYKKCIRQAWNSRPWLTNIGIGVNEQTQGEYLRFSTKNEPKWKLDMRKFEWYHPFKSLSFLD